MKKTANDKGWVREKKNRVTKEKKEGRKEGRRAR